MTVDHDTSNPIPLQCIELTGLDTTTPFLCSLELVGIRFNLNILGNSYLLPIAKDGTYNAVNLCYASDFYTVTGPLSPILRRFLERIVPPAHLLIEAAERGDVEGLQSVTHPVGLSDRLFDTLGVRLSSKHRILDQELLVWKFPHHLWELTFRVHAIPSQDRSAALRFCTKSGTSSSNTKRWLNLTPSTALSYLPFGLGAPPKSGSFSTPPVHPSFPPALALARFVLKVFTEPAHARSLDGVVGDRLQCIGVTFKSYVVCRTAFVEALRSLVVPSSLIRVVDLVALSRPGLEDPSYPLSARLLGLLTEFPPIHGTVIVLDSPETWVPPKSPQAEAVLQVLKQYLDDNRDGLTSSPFFFIFLFDCSCIPTAFDSVIDLHLGDTPTPFTATTTSIPSLLKPLFTSPLPANATTQKASLPHGLGAILRAASEAELWRVLRDIWYSTLDAAFDGDSHKILEPLTSRIVIEKISEVLGDSNRLTPGSSNTATDDDTNLLGLHLHFDTFLSELDKPQQESIRLFLSSVYPRTDDVATHECHEPSPMCRSSGDFLPPPGLLLCGPPGSGKSKFCLALQTLPGIKVFPVVLSQIITAAVGVSQQRLQNLFAEAFKGRPSIIVFEDIDSLISPRIDDNTFGEELASYFCSLMDNMPVVLPKDGAVGFLMTTQSQDPINDLPDIIRNRFPQTLTLLH